jgi:hypothetical protein
MYYNGTNLVTTGAGSTDQCLKSTTGSAPTWGTCGTATTLQDAYANSGTANPQITLNSTNGGIKIRDASGGVSGNLFQIQNNAGTVTIFGVSATAMTLQNSSGDAMSFDTVTNTLRIYNPSDDSKYAELYYDNAASEAVFAASSGTTRIGNGSGNIILQMSSAADVLQATKSAALSGAYTANDFTFSRTIGASSNSLGGSVVKIESNSTGTNQSSNLLVINEASATSTGNLILATTGGSSERFKVSNTGATTVGGLLTASAGLTVSGGNVNLNTSGSSSVNIGTGSSTGTVTIGNQSGGNNVLITANNFAVDATGNFSGVDNLIMGGKLNADVSDANGLRVRNSTGTIGLLNIDSTGSGTTGLSLQVGSSTTDANAVELILDSYNNATDPSGTNGAMYYNSSLGKFRCYENSSWKNCIHPEGIVSKTADQTANLNSSVFQNATDLVVALDSNSVYNFEVIVPINIPNDDADAQYTFTVPSGATITGLGHVGQIEGSGSSSSNHGMCGLTSSAQECNITIATGTGAVRTVIVMHGTVKTAGTAGNLQLQFSQNAANATSGTAPTLLQGGMIKYVKQ